MARGRPKAPTQASVLVEALTFVEAGVGEFEHWHNFVRLSGNMAISYNGQIAAGHPITEELTLCPQMDKLKLALAKSGKKLVIAETPSGQLSIKGEHIRALVPCLKAEDMPYVAPDMPVAVISDGLKEAFKVCGVFTTEAARAVHEASLLLEANTCTGTNGHCLLQYWHGLNFPPKIVLPKVFTAAIVKQDKPITGFGFSWNGDGSKVNSFTIWFEGGCWIKTLCYADPWPELSRVIDVQTFPANTPAGLFDAVEAVVAFSDEGTVRFGNEMVMSHDFDTVGAQYGVKGIQAGKKFNGKYLRSIANFAKTIDLTTFPDRIFFFGGEASNPIRGAIMTIGQGSGPAHDYQPDAPGAANQVQEVHDAMTADYEEDEEASNQGWDNV